MEWPGLPHVDHEAHDDAPVAGGPVHLVRVGGSFTVVRVVAHVAEQAALQCVVRVAGTATSTSIRHAFILNCFLRTNLYIDFLRRLVPNPTSL